uniref:Leptin receptor overlapping transcript-like 1 n=1 Tax=Romanomermis culicivorax TaxID=13658 RepID=A0A915JW16_ROMCU
MLAFSGCMGLLFLVLGCALKGYNWWPLFLLVFYFFVPLPITIGRRFSDDSSSSSACMEMALFLTTGIVVSGFGLPFVLAHSGAMMWGAAAFVCAGNVVIFATIAAYFWVHRDDDSIYGIF